ncbi:hypothetical protein VNO77_24625 [Canavalia gladiata]|uniref:Uncharacterized protein n=1 Tax=Canavalia gladiata TaxID=3824 RepID=A0AAN9L820_CANGL
MNAYMNLCMSLDDPNSILLFITLNWLGWLASVACGLCLDDPHDHKCSLLTKVLLDNVPVHKLADIFVASFETSFEEQLSILDSVDPKMKLSKATELVDRHLQSICVAEKITQKVEGQQSKSQKEFLLHQLVRARATDLKLTAKEGFNLLEGLLMLYLKMGPQQV